MNHPSSTHPASGAVQGAARRILRLEGAALLVAGVFGYVHVGLGWGLFAALFLVPDLSLLGYAFGPRAGAAIYNAAHTTLGPALLVAAGLALDAPPGSLAVAAIWAAHVGFDRALGFGLKSGARFGETHLGAIGSAGRVPVRASPTTRPA